MGRAWASSPTAVWCFTEECVLVSEGCAFFSNFASYLSDQRGAIGLLIPHTGGKSQSASLLNMAAAGYIYGHTSAYGKAITAQSRVQSGAVPSPLWLLADVLWNMKRWRLVIASLGPISEQILLFQLEFIPQRWLFSRVPTTEKISFIPPLSCKTQSNLTLNAFCLFLSFTFITYFPCQSKQTCLEPSHKQRSS